ncbi:MFS general substrate transporter [Rhizodiscina lignyota]|uniref:MFS general substrate transporter n=1 Tax=Rhizodiscina lignyota TaxID=1504668 RepID=A0A9P4I8R4_9PEZI|nr:MFS general substrate transporter [Rhizodiscina lignyota]
MANALLRDSPFGQLVRYATNKRLFKYPEEEEGWECPNTYSKPDALEEKLAEANAANEASASEDPVYPDPESRLEEDKDYGHTGTPHSSHLDHLEGIHSAKTQQSGLSRVGTRGALQKSITRADLEQQFTLASMERGPSMPVIPEKLDDGTILVDWYTTDDPENPQNWSLGKKAVVSTQIYLYTLAVYMGSAIYAPSELGIVVQFGVSQQVAALGLSMYVLAYGIGPMLWSPISEMPLVGRNPPYMITYALFVILLVPTALVENMPGLAVLRFLLGFFGSPCLATGGASLQDMFSLIKLPYVLSLWAFAATCGPSLGPIISGFSVVAENWRWSQWELLWLAGPIWISMFFLLPETSSSNILLRRARRLRALTGDNRLKSQSEIDQGNLKLSALIEESLWRPIQMMFLDPAVAFTAVYTALIYGIYYSFFEAFPIVYIEMYGFNIGEQGLTFLSITVGVLISISTYWAYVYWIVEPEIRTRGIGAPERRLIPALFVSFLCPIGLFIFAWASNPSVHWIGSVIGIVVFTIGIFLIIQCIFLYLPLTYPQYAASLFAGNDFARSTLACGAIHFSTPLYRNLGVGRGVSLLAGLTCGCIFGVFVLFFYGDKLRARSKFAAK